MIRGPVRLFVYSALMLFTELALIRWLGSNIFFLSYFSNFVLLGSFLGIGVGFLRARAQIDLSRWAPFALAILISFTFIFHPEVQRSSDQLVFTGGDAETTGLPPWALLPFVFAAVTLVMAMIGEGVARTFVEFSPLRAYRLDILGSVAGIVTFTTLSFLGASPLVWGAIISVLMIVVLGRTMRVVGYVAIAVMLVGLGKESLDPTNSWSPYYKVTTHVISPTSVSLYVNEVPHQSIRDPIRDMDATMAALDWPYEEVTTSLNDVLIVGAGTGNDVAVALHHGARHIDAVEIDPLLHDIGVQLHPDHPYQDPRVDVHITDGRAFLEHTTKRYDLILFAMPDSITLVTGQSSLRLESYLFTAESMQTVRARLTTGGAFSMFNYYRSPWVVDRLAGTLQDAYGYSPCLRTAGSPDVRYDVLTIARSDSVMHCGVGRWTEQATGPIPTPATDDYPFLYLRTPSIPSLYLLTLIPILLMSVVAVGAAGGRIATMGRYLDLFFMGAAFLLLETKSVVQFALLFGTTWFVNALVFTGVLVAVYIAIEVTQRWSVPNTWALYGALFVALLVAWLVPAHALLGLDLAPRILGASALAFTPIMIANLIFAGAFKQVGRASTTAFGANLLGAMAGGVLEYSALIFGYRALLIVVAVLYALTLISTRLRPRAGLA